MRVVTWNCKGAFHRKHDFTAFLKPDILIVPECEKLSGLAQTFGSTPSKNFQWFGSDARKGLAVISYGDYSFEVHPDYDARHRWIVPLRVSGPRSFVLFAVWTLPTTPSRSYVQPLFEAFEFYMPMMKGLDVVWAGDFNANFVFDRPSRKYKFKDFVELAGRHGLQSAYHQQLDCEHGMEPDKTYFHHHEADKGYHIDYVFSTENVRPQGCEVSVGSYDDWSKRSDHMPVIADFH